MTGMDFVYKYWFPKGFSEEIYIVCPRDSSLTYDANMWSDDYAYLDSFGDKDLLFLVYGFICKHYPQAKVHYSFSSQYKKEHPNDWKQKNLIILGGASWSHEVTRTFMHDALRKIYNNNTGIDKPPVVYSIKNNKEGWKQVKQKVCDSCLMLQENCREDHSLCIWAQSSDLNKPLCKSIERAITREIVAPTPLKLQEKVDEVSRHLSEDQQQRIYSDSDGRYLIKDCISKDIGLFAAFQNPYNKRSRVIMINGAHTFGGVGAFRTFDVDKDIAIKNYQMLDSELSSKGKDFISYFMVEVDDTALICDQCTELKAENIISLYSNEELVDILVDSDCIEELLQLFIDFKKEISPFAHKKLLSDEIDTLLYNVSVEIIGKINELIDKMSLDVNKAQLEQYRQEYHNLRNQWNQSRGLV